MKLFPDRHQEKITVSLIVALVLVVIACFSGIGETLRGGGMMMRLFLVFLGAIIVGAILAVQIIPGLITLDGMIKGISSLSRKKNQHSGRAKGR